MVERVGMSHTVFGRLNLNHTYRSHDPAYDVETRQQPPSSAFLASALDLDGVIRWGESSQVADLFDELVYAAFVLFREFDVLDGPALHADQVVVVTSDPLSQLVASDASSTEVRLYHACVFENYQRAVQRRHRNSPTYVRMELGYRTRPSTLCHCSDHGAASLCVTDSAFAQSGFNFTINGRV